jgi:hypothetical protein
MYLVIGSTVVVNIRSTLDRASVPFNVRQQDLAVCVFIEG